MTCHPLNRRAAVACFVFFLAGATDSRAAAPVAARQAGQGGPTPQSRVAPDPRAPRSYSDRALTVAVPQTAQQWGSDARKTRQDLVQLLGKCPPALGRVLKLDPSLMLNQAYLAAYPELAAFLVAHPEIARDPRYFLESVTIGDEYRPDPREQNLDLWRHMVEGTAMFMVFLVLTGAVVWLVKALIDYRRWNRLSKVHVEVHNKLLDRFSNNEELLAYVQSPAGLRFLETAPHALTLESGDWNGPVRRILWAVQSGLVLAAGGVGLLFVSARVVEDIRQPLFAIGAVVLSLGLGFVVSAVASYVLTVRMGLLKAPGRSADEGGRPASPRA